MPKFLNTEGPDRRQILSWLKKRKVAVLKGGWSSERAISLKTGAAVENSFKRLGIASVGIDVTRNIAFDLVKKKTGFCFNALHGPFGEDGRINPCWKFLKSPTRGQAPWPAEWPWTRTSPKNFFKPIISQRRHGLSSDEPSMKRPRHHF